MAEMPFGFANDKAEAHTRKQDQQLKSGNPDMVARGGAAPRPEPKKLLRFCGRTNGKIRAATRPPPGQSPRMDKRQTALCRILVARGGAAR
jgi:hypothetical protein